MALAEGDSVVVTDAKGYELQRCNRLFHGKFSRPQDRATVSYRADFDITLEAGKTYHIFSLRSHPVFNHYYYQEEKPQWKTVGDFQVKSVYSQNSDSPFRPLDHPHQLQFALAV
eukprot:CAMPEP_0168561918 /NCGR_PEP_ID=MMETSP0413-20121227/11851_1 /TAXON_ID=136452 /ORGANISM="Filamoeba nolandi, Strain NC-AS-23-1" /LENGTH=113 /DNA_ID=CAMNT_0008593321 /DNA_START=318 /DNA_END=659 /DNA_ORIENTATION=-